MNHSMHLTFQIKKSKINNQARPRYTRELLSMEKGRKFQLNAQSIRNSQPNKIDLDKNLYFFCRYKMETMEADVWIGIGDTHRSKLEFDIQSAFIARNQSK